MKIENYFFITLLSKDLLSHYLGGTLIKYVLLGLLLGLIFKTFNHKKFELKYSRLVLLFSIIYILKTAFFDFTILPYLLGPIIAFFIPSDWVEKSKKMLIIIALVNIVLMLYEFYLGEYIYDLFAVDGSVLNAKLFGGHAEIFRAKGLFPGPLSAVAYIYCVALIHSFNKTSSILLLLFGFLTVGRLALLVGFIFLLYNYRKSKLMILVMLLAVVLGFYYYSGSVTNFILLALDFKNSNNLSRFLAWEYGLGLIFNFNILEFFIGASYLVDKSIAFENDWIRILYSTGLFGLIAYVYMIFKIKEVSSVIIALVISIIMFVFPLVQSLAMTLLFSLYIKKIMYDKKNI